MQVFVIINNKTNTFNLEDNDLNKFETLCELIEKRLMINKNFFILNNGCKRLKEYDEIKHEKTLYLSYKFINSKKLCIKDKEYYLPINIMLESKMISNMILDDEESIQSDDIIFDNDNLITNKSLNNWINISYLINDFLNEKNKELKDFSIPKPLLNSDLKYYVGSKIFSYLNKLELDNLKELATMADYMDITYLLDIVCAFIAVKYVRNNTLENIKELDLI